MKDSTTVCDLFRQIGCKITDGDAVTDDALVCQVSITSSGKDAVEVSAFLRVAHLSRFGFFVIIVLVNETQPLPQQ